MPIVKPPPRYPSLYQVNPRVWLHRLSAEAGRPVTLADIGDAVLDEFAAQGFDWIWLLSVWQIGEAGRAVSRTLPGWQAEFAATLPDLRPDDICGSGFAITEYSVADALGGDSVLADFRTRLAQRGIQLLLDYVPNHTALDHPWVASHPDYYIAGSEDALAAAPKNFTRVGSHILAHGRDPNFPGWPDTLQLNYANPALQAARTAELRVIAEKCDGIRCDMAMLLLPDIFERTWGLRPPPFWPDAIAAVHAVNPDFTFMAEVYWDLEWELMQQGFDYCYDKRLYDRLCDGNAASIRAHLAAGLSYQDRLVRFLENHDEPRAAVTFPWPQQRAAAVVSFLSPGLRFFHQGQFEGDRVRLPVHLCRAPAETANPEIAAFYTRLLQVLRNTAAFRDGVWSQIDPQPAWPGNSSHDGFIAFAWTGTGGGRYVIAVNDAPAQAQCRLILPFPELQGRAVHLIDLLGPETYERDGNELLAPGLFIDHAPWHCNVFALAMA